MDRNEQRKFAVIWNERTLRQGEENEKDRNDFIGISSMFRVQLQCVRFPREGD